MTEFLTYFFLFLRFAVECYVADYIFTFTLRRRKRYALRIGIAIGMVLVLLILMAIICTLAQVSDIELVQMICFALILGPINLGWLTFCFKDSGWNIVFCAVFGLLVKLGTISIVDGIKHAIPEDSMFAFFGQEDVIGLLTHYLAIFIIYAIVYWIFGRDYERSDSFVRCGKRIIPLYLFTAFVLPLLAFARFELMEQGVSYGVLLELCQAAICFMVISVQFSLSREMFLDGKNRTMDVLLIQSQKQFDTLKESIEIINLKCHDMRHQLRALEKGQIDKEYIDELEKAIAIYDSTIKTGNNVLDVILTDKSLRCNAYDIEFTCIADGDKLSFMQENDINSLFGNALENAMEYEANIPEHEKRFISLIVKSEANLLYVCIENYWCGESIEWHNGLPLTTKGEDTMHGFGMLSMRRVAEKYGGSLQVKTENDLFQVTIVIPL